MLIILLKMQSPTTISNRQSQILNSRKFKDHKKNDRLNHDQTIASRICYLNHLLITKKSDKVKATFFKVQLITESLFQQASGQRRLIAWNTLRAAVHSQPELFPNISLSHEKRYMCVLELSV